MKRMFALAAMAPALAACAPPPANDLSGTWQVQQIAGASLGQGVEISISVDPSGDAVTGFTGCNNFTATLTTFQTNVSFSPPEEEAGECPDAAAATDEARFLGVLPSVRRYVRHGRSLELLPAAPGAEALIRLRLTDQTDGS